MTLRGASNKQYDTTYHCSLSSPLRLPRRTQTPLHKQGPWSAFRAIRAWSPGKQDSTDELRFNALTLICEGVQLITPDLKAGYISLMMLQEALYPTVSVHKVADRRHLHKSICETHICELNETQLCNAHQCVYVPDQNAHVSCCIVYWRTIQRCPAQFDDMQCRQVCVQCSHQEVNMNRSWSSSDGS